MKETIESTMRRFMSDCCVPDSYQGDVIYYLTQPHGLLAGENLKIPVDCIQDVRLSGMIKSCGIQAVLLGDYDNVDHLWLHNVRYTVDRSIWSIGKQGQFASCSYDELTSCLKHRLDIFKEYRGFLNGELTEFNHVRWLVRMSQLSLREEIRYLLKRRRELKRDRRAATAVLNQSLKAGGFNS